ncbi:MAG: nucleotide exchange factor GrpE [Deinococcales bacterium]
MNDPKEHDDSTVGTVDDARREADGAAPGAGDGGGTPDEGAQSGAAGAPEEAGSARGAADQEVDILRSELTRVQEQLEEAKREAAEFRDRYLRSRAELENYRRRAADDVERAREAGLDSAVLAVLTVFDDLGRALQAAEASDDPTSIVPGVRAVKESLERNLENLDIRPIGEPGEPFDPNEHEALTAVPLIADAEPGTIADVFQAGFKRGDRLVRPARVVVYKEPEEA